MQRKTPFSSKMQRNGRQRCIVSNCVVYARKEKVIPKGWLFSFLCRVVMSTPLPSRKRRQILFKYCAIVFEKQKA